MTHTQIITLSAIGLYFLAMIVVGLVAGRDTRYQSFEIGARNVGYIPTMGSLAASIRDGGGIVFWVGCGLGIGYGGMWAFLGLFVGTLFYAVLGPRARRLAQEHGYITVGQVIRHQLGKITERSTSALVLFIALLAIALQLYVSGNLFATIVGLPSWIGIFSVAIVVGFYLFFGGYGTVVKTDAIQFFLIVALIVAPFFLKPSMEDIENWNSLFSMKEADRIGFFLLGLFLFLGGSDVWQRLFSARSDKVIRVSFPFAGVFLIIMTLSLIFLGMGIKQYLPDVAPDQAFFSLFNGSIMASPYFIAFVGVVAMAITMSTTDTYCYLFSSTLTKNYLPDRFHDMRATYVRTTRITMLIVLLATSIVAAIFIESAVSFLFGLVALMYILAPIYVLACMGSFIPRRALDMMISGSLGASLVLYAALMAGGYFEEIIWTAVPGIFSSILCVTAWGGYRVFEKYGRTA